MIVGSVFSEEVRNELVFAFWDISFKPNQYKFACIQASFIQKNHWLLVDFI